jgi:hypothetical protein
MVKSNTNNGDAAMNRSNSTHTINRFHYLRLEAARHAPETESLMLAIWRDSKPDGFGSTLDGQRAAAWAAAHVLTEYPGEGARFVSNQLFEFAKA